MSHPVHSEGHGNPSFAQSRNLTSEIRLPPTMPPMRPHAITLEYPYQARKRRIRSCRPKCLRSATYFSKATAAKFEAYRCRICRNLPVSSPMQNAVAGIEPTETCKIGRSARIHNHRAIRLRDKKSLTHAKGGREGLPLVTICPLALRLVPLLYRKWGLR